MIWDEHKLDMLEYNPFWIWFVQKPSVVFLDALDKIMDGGMTERMGVADLNRVRGGKL